MKPSIPVSREEKKTILAVMKQDQNDLNSKNSTLTTNNKKY